MNAIDIIKKSHYSEFELTPLYSGSEVQSIVETLADHITTTMSEHETEIEEQYETKINDLQDDLDKYHTELSDRTIDVRDNILKTLSELVELASDQDPEDLASWLDDNFQKVLSEFDRIETEIFFEV